MTQNELVFLENDCEDQCCTPVDHCTKWRCKNAKLIKREQFWCCPICGASYGENPHPKLR